MTQGLSSPAHRCPSNLLPALSLVPAVLMAPEPALMAGQEPTGPALSPAGSIPERQGWAVNPFTPCTKGCTSQPRTTHGLGRGMRLGHV